MPKHNANSNLKTQNSKLGVAPGKVILCGEHAVVYGQPALAVPVNGVQAKVTVQGSSELGLHVDSCNLDDLSSTERQRINQRLQAVAERVALLIGGIHMGGRPPTLTGGGLQITIDSTIPIERGLGSGAAIGVAMIRAFAAYFGLSLSDEQVSLFAYESEKLHHGTPSGIDNAVVAYNQPIYFVRGESIERLAVGASLHLLIADSGIRGSTADIVTAVRERHAANPALYDALFRQVGDISRQAKAAIGQGDMAQLGGLFNRNQRLLKQIEVSSDALDLLCYAAREAGALGAKLSGAGRGGNMIALVTPDTRERVRANLLVAGAVNVIDTVIAPSKDMNINQ